MNVARRLTADERARVAALLDKYGRLGTLNALGIAETTLDAVLAGAELRPVTVARVRAVIGDGQVSA